MKFLYTQEKNVDFVLKTKFLNQQSRGVDKVPSNAKTTLQRKDQEQPNRHTPVHQFLQKQLNNFKKLTSKTLEIKLYCLLDRLGT